MKKRLARGDQGKNPLDAACRDHDIAYETIEDSKGRRKADKILIDRAIKRIFSGDAKLDERAAALLVTALMTAKVKLTKIGLGLGAKTNKKMVKKRVNRSSKRQTIAFGELVRGARESIKGNKLKKLSDSALKGTIRAAIRSAKELKRGKTVKTPRVLKVPKFGGSLSRILPILSGLSAIGSISASAVGVVKALKDIENAKKQLAEGQHNTNEETKIGRALNLIHKTDKTIRGTGFYLKPHQPQR